MCNLKTIMVLSCSIIHNVVCTVSLDHPRHISRGCGEDEGLVQTTGPCHGVISGPLVVCSARSHLAQKSMRSSLPQALELKAHFHSIIFKRSLIFLIPFVWLFVYLSWFPYVVLLGILLSFHE